MRFCERQTTHTCVLLPSGRVCVSSVWCRRRPDDVTLSANPYTSASHSHKSAGYLRRWRKINKTLNFRDSGTPNIPKRVVFIVPNRPERHNPVELLEIMSISVVINIALCLVFFSFFIYLFCFIPRVVYLPEWCFYFHNLYFFEEFI